MIYIYEPFFYHSLYLRVFVDATIVHNDNRVGCRIWLHVIEKTVDKMSKALNTVGAFDNFTVNDSIQRKCWKD